MTFSVGCLWHTSKKNAVSLYEQSQSPPIGLWKIFIDYFFFQADQWDCTKSSSIFNRFASYEQPERAKFVTSQFPTQSLGWLVNYGWRFVSKLGHNIRAVFSHVYLQSFLLHDIRAFFCHVYLRFIPKYMTIFLQTRIYMRTKKPIYIRYKQACVYGVTESRRIRGNELYRQQKTPSCTMELKSNFSLNSAWPQWPRLSRARFGSYSLPSQ